MSKILKGISSCSHNQNQLVVFQYANLSLAGHFNWVLEISLLLLSFSIFLMLPIAFRPVYGNGNQENGMV